MTDITDQERRTAIDVAEAIERGDYPLASTWPILARVILATVDAPARTLADEIRGMPDFTMSGENCINDCHELADALATRVDQMERDLAEARTEAEFLTDERLDRNPETKARVKAALNNLEQAETVTVQKGAESNAETPDPADVPLPMPPGDIPGTALPIHIIPKLEPEESPSISLPDPADVKPGEAWIVECRGERRNAVKDNGIDIPWNTINADGWYLSEDNGDVTLIARLVPAPRVITNTDELEEQVHGTIIRDGGGDMYQRILHGWYRSGSEQVHRSDDNVIILPATVLWEPEA